MSLTEILRDILARDAALVGWCVSVYGRPPLVVVGIDDRDPPNPETDYPLIALESLGATSGLAAARFSRTVLLAVGVRQPARDQATATAETAAGPVEVPTVTARGALEVEALRDLAVSAINSAAPRLGLGNISEDSESEEISLHPLYTSFCAIRFERTNVKPR